MKSFDYFIHSIGILPALRKLRFNSFINYLDDIVFFEWEDIVLRTTYKSTIKLTDEEIIINM